MQVETAAEGATLDFYQQHHESHSYPRRFGGPLTMAGAVLLFGTKHLNSVNIGNTYPLSGIYCPRQIGQAEWGIEVNPKFCKMPVKRPLEIFLPLAHFEQFLINFLGFPLRKEKFLNYPKFAHTLKSVGWNNGLMDFYQGDIAKDLAADLAEAGSPISLKRS